MPATFWLYAKDQWPIILHYFYMRRNDDFLITLIIIASPKNIFH